MYGLKKLFQIMLIGFFSLALLGVNCKKAPDKGTEDKKIESTDEAKGTDKKDESKAEPVKKKIKKTVGEVEAGS